MRVYSRLIERRLNGLHKAAQALYRFIRCINRSRPSSHNVAQSVTKYYRVLPGGRLKNCSQKTEEHMSRQAAATAENLCVEHRQNGNGQHIVVEGRYIRFASKHQAKKAGRWAMKRYAETFRKLASS